MFVVWFFEHLRRGEAIVTFQQIAVEITSTENDFWLSEKLWHLRAREDDFRLAGEDAGEDVSHVLLAIL